MLAYLPSLFLRLEDFHPCLTHFRKPPDQSSAGPALDVPISALRLVESASARDRLLERFQRGGEPLAVAASDGDVVAEHVSADGDTHAAASYAALFPSRRRTFISSSAARLIDTASSWLPPLSG